MGKWLFIVIQVGEEGNLISFAVLGSKKLFRVVVTVEVEGKKEDGLGIEMGMAQNQI